MIVPSLGAKAHRGADYLYAQHFVRQANNMRKPTFRPLAELRR
jgi:hypothetical protein